MIEAAECAGMCTWLGVWCRESMLRRAETSPAGRATVKSPTMKSAAVIEVVAIGENPAMGLVVVVVETDVVMMPIRSPVVPSPPKAAKVSDSEAEAKRNSGARKKQSRIRIPPRPDSDGHSIHQPRIIFRHVNDLGVGWFDHNGLSLLAHLFLRCAL